MIEITEKKIDVQKVIDAVKSPDCGAVSVFIGTVRNHSKNKDVNALEYEVYGEMAEKMIQTIIDKIKIDKDARASITSLVSDEGAAELLIHENKLKGIYVKDTGQYTFEPYINEKDISKLSETADLTLKTTALLPIAADEYILQVVQLANGFYSLATELDAGFVKIHIYESIQTTSDVNFEL